MNTLKPPDVARNRPDQPRSPVSERVSLSRSPHPYYRFHNDAHQRQAEQPGSPQEAHSRPSSTESGTEADDEKGTILRGLPAPPVRARKGLRGESPGLRTPAVSPLPTPPALLHTQPFFDFNRKPDQDVSKEDQEKQQAYIRRRRGEIVRRSTETLLLAAISIVIWLQAGEASKLRPWLPELILYAALPPCAYLLYPIRRSQLAYSTSKSPIEALLVGFHIPSRFDPGPLLYPVVFPVLIALTLLERSANFLPVNIVCGLSSVPMAVATIWQRDTLTWYLRWIASFLPIHLPTVGMVSELAMIPLGLKAAHSTTLEQCTFIFPLHQSLKSVLGYLTTTSLDPAELDLLTTGLVNLHLFAITPQSQILKAAILVGGLSILITCRRLMLWEVELARIPKWKFAKQPQKNALLYRAYWAFASFMKDPPPSTDSSDDEIDQRMKTPMRPLSRVTTLTNATSSYSLRKSTSNGTIPNNLFRLGRRNTISSLDAKTKEAAHSKTKRSKNLQALQASQFLTLTSQQAKIRRYLYAGIVYVLVLLAIAFPARQYVAIKALDGQEPFGWAAGYLFGGIPVFRDLVLQLGLDSWIKLPHGTPSALVESGSGFFELLAFSSNVRLILCGYCILIVGVGIIAVLQLTCYVEVDTRRKVFHGVMVIMLLPTIYVDPCFFALALSLILALFLLLDVFRASQLPPISRPLTNFLAPYVDGRDHRGPVIVSHIFLLIGCAIPLWLSLAGAQRSGDDPWIGWSTPTRDLSMISGVVSVGMGDAAASLIGRRYGRTKWYWGGGKSLEGSLAFAAAVTAGLIFSYSWLRLGRWTPWEDTDFWSALIKCFMAASGASLLESVLTAANDNVVVPVGLWLLVRGLKI